MPRPEDAEAILAHFADPATIDAMERRLRAFVDIASGTTDREGLARMRSAFEAALADAGLAVDVRRGGVVVGERGGEGTRVLIVGHLDTVYPPGEPFHGVVERTIDGHRHFVGPGTADMKAGLVVALAAVDAVRRVAPTDCGPVTLAANQDEERGSPASRETIAALATAHDIGIVVEPGFDHPDGGATVVDARAGLARVGITVHGVESHSGNERAAGLSAVAAASRLVRPLDALTDEAEDLLVTVCTFEGGKSINQVPGEARLGIDVRFRDEPQWERVLAAINALVDESVDENPTTGDRTRAEVEVLTHKPPMPRLPAVSPFADALLAAAADLGQTLRPGRRNGTSDGNHTAKAGLPTLDGMGAVGRAMHVSGDESIRASSLPERGALLALWLLRQWRPAGDAARG